MLLYMDEMIRCFAMGLDVVESDFLGCSTYHGHRIGILSAAMAKHVGLNDDVQIAVASCALLHDNALTEYILSERPGSAQDFNMIMHCELGQANVDVLPFKADVEGLVLYHHERADGLGPFRKKSEEFPLGAQFIAIADNVDSTWHLQRLKTGDLPALHEDVKRKAGTVYTEEAADAFLAVLDEEMLLSLNDDKILWTTQESIPRWRIDICDQGIMNLAGISARIIDYKSSFTYKHSVQVANIAWILGEHYGYDREKLAKLYLAAAFHDLGKLYTPTALLEKPGPLTPDEYATVQRHAWWTYELLSRVSGLSEVCRWASDHHEKMDGLGYPNHKGAGQQDFETRMIACIDVYQAVSDNRPYHPPRNHKDTMAIMRDMVYQGKLDPDIVQDMDKQLDGYPFGDFPSPPGAIV